MYKSAATVVSIICWSSLIKTCTSLKWTCVNRAPLVIFPGFKPYYQFKKFLFSRAVFTSVPSQHPMWNSAGFTPSAQRNLTAAHYSAVVQSCNGVSNVYITLGQSTALFIFRLPINHCEYVVLWLLCNFKLALLFDYLSYIITFYIMITCAVVNVTFHIMITCAVVQCYFQCQDHVYWNTLLLSVPWSHVLWQNVTFCIIITFAVVKQYFLYHDHLCCG